MYRKTFLAVSSLAGVFFLCFMCNAAWADTSPSIESYLTKMILAVALLGGVGFLLVRWGPKRSKASGKGLEVLTSLSLGRGVLYVVRCGPDVILLAENKDGFEVLQRYRGDTWESLNEAESQNTDTL